MLRRFGLLLFLVLCLSLPAWAQTPTTEIFGGVSFIRDSDLNFPGWQASIAKNYNPVVSAVADFGGQYRYGIKVHEFMGGFRANMRGSKVTVFGQGLAGAMNARGSGSSLTGFAIGPGAGVDINAGDKFSIRAIQFDLISARLAGSWSTDIRMGFGIVIPFGK